MRFEGHIKSWTDDRGFGFIEPASGGQEIFVHIKSLPSRLGRPRPGQPVSFEVELNNQRLKRAINVELLRSPSRNLRRRSEPSAGWSIASACAIPLFIAVYAVVAVKWHVPAWLAVAYLALSIACFIAYACDKSAARAGTWRVRESSLHLFSLAGGWPGALIAQRLFRHKSSKAEFQTIFWATVWTNVAAFVTFYSPFLSMLRV